MPSTIRQLMPPIVPPDTEVKVQAMISLRAKRIVLSAIGDDGVFTFLINHAFLRAANFIEQNDIKSYDPTKFKLFTDFIRDGADSRSAGSAAAQHDARTTSSIQHSDASTSRKPSSSSQSDSGRSGRKAVKK